MVIDRMRSETVPFADEWVRPKIGTDTALGLAVARVILHEGLYDELFVSRWVTGFDQIKKHLEALTSEWAEERTGIPAGRIRDLARLYAKTDGAAVVDGNGHDMHTTGVDMVRAVYLLVALTGNIDKPSLVMRLTPGAMIVHHSDPVLVQANRRGLCEPWVSSISSWPATSSLPQRPKHRTWCSPLPRTWRQSTTGPNRVSEG